MSLENCTQQWRIANDLQEVNRPHLYLRALFWNFGCAHNLDLWSIIYSLVFLSCPHLLPSVSFPSGCFGLPPNTFPQHFPFSSSSPNLLCLIGWDDQNLNNQCWHFWVPSLGVRLNLLGGTEPWELTACRALSLVVCMFSTIGLKICSVFEDFYCNFVAHLKRTTVQVLQNIYHENTKPVKSHEQDTSRIYFERFFIFLFSPLGIRFPIVVSGSTVHLVSQCFCKQAIYLCEIWI